MKVFPLGSEPGTPIFLAFIPGLFLLKKLPKMIVFLLLFGGAYISFFFMMGIQMRYLLPALALLSIVAAYAADGLLAIDKAGIDKVFGLALVFPLLFNLQHYARDTTHKIPVALGLEPRSEYLSRTVDVYDMYSYVNSNLPSSAKLIAPWEVRRYYVDRDFITPNTGADAWEGNFGSSRDPGEILEKLRELGVTHVMINHNYHDHLVSLYRQGVIKDDPDRHPLLDDAMKKHYRPIYEKNNVNLYELAF